MAFIKCAVLLTVSAFVLSAAEDLKGDSAGYGYLGPGYGHRQSSPEYEPYGMPGYGQPSYEHGQGGKAAGAYGHLLAYVKEPQGQKNNGYGPSYDKKPGSYSSY